MLATDVMRTWFATVKPNAPLLDAVHLLLETNQRGLPVIDDNGSLVGVISEGDFLHRRELGVTCSAGFLLEWLLGREKGQLVREILICRWPGVGSQVGTGKISPLLFLIRPMRSGTGQHQRTVPAEIGPSRRPPTKRPGSEAGQSNREYHPGLAMAEAYMRPRIVSVQKVTQEHNNREQVAIFLSYRQHRPIPLPRR